MTRNDDGSVDCSKCGLPLKAIGVGFTCLSGRSNCPFEVSGKAKPNASIQMDEEPPINKAIGDIVAIAGGDPRHEATVLQAAMMLCCEYLGRAVGRTECRVILENLDRHMKDAQPVRPWRD